MLVYHVRMNALVHQKDYLMKWIAHADDHPSFPLH